MPKLILIKFLKLKIDKLNYNINFILLNKYLMVKLTINLGNDIIQIIEVKVTEPLNVLKEKLDIQNNNIKFIYNGMTYSVNCNLNFKDIGLTTDSYIFLNIPAISG